MISRDEIAAEIALNNAMAALAGSLSAFFSGVYGYVFPDLFISAYVTSNPYFRFVGAGASAATLGFFGYRTAANFIRSLAPHYQPDVNTNWHRDAAQLLNHSSAERAAPAA